MAGTVAHTAEEATVRELRRSALRLLFMLAALGLVVVPLLQELPLGQSSQTGLLAWLLVVLGFYWLYAGLAQLLCFSAAATLLSTKILLVIVDVHRLTVLRHLATGLILVGAAGAAANLGGMLVSLYRRTRGVAGEQ